MSENQAVPLALGQGHLSLREILLSEEVCKLWKEWRLPLGPVQITTGPKGDLDTMICADWRADDDAKFRSKLRGLANNIDRIESLQLAICSPGQLLYFMDDVEGIEHALKGLTMYCYHYDELPANDLVKLTRLQQLTLLQCGALEQLPDTLWSLTGLQQLTVTSSPSTVTELPAAISQLSHLQQLILKSCSDLETIPEAFTALSSLQHLEIVDCRRILELTANFSHLISLTNLTWTNYAGDTESLHPFPTFLPSLISLQHLHIGLASHLSILPESLSKLTSLRYLSLYRTQITRLPAWFSSSFSHLTLLHFSRWKQLTELPSTLGSLSRLQDLSLQVLTSLTSLPDSVSTLTSLKFLHIASCDGLVSYPANLGNLSSPQDLSIITSHPSLPASVSNLTSLTSLALASYHPPLSDEICSIPNLRRLLFECDDQTYLPEALGHLTALTYLSMYNCRFLRSLPSTLGGLSSLVELEVERCSDLAVLPDSLGDLAQLQRLFLYGCHGFTTLPATIGKLQALTSLQVQKCWGLQHLPEGLGDLGQLQVLELDVCDKLEALPETIGGLSNLTCLNLTACFSLKQLPQGLTALSTLKLLKTTSCNSFDEQAKQTLALLVELRPELQVKWP